MFDIPKLQILRRLLLQARGALSQAIEIVEDDLRARGAAPRDTAPCREDAEPREVARP